MNSLSASYFKISGKDYSYGYNEKWLHKGSNEHFKWFCSVFQEETQRKQLKVKIEMAKFLQDTVEEMAITAKQTKSQKAVVEFANFFEKVRLVNCIYTVQ